MAQRWKKVWIIPRPRKRGATFQVVYHDRRRTRRHYDRSFRSERLAKEYARKLELFLNGAGQKPELSEASPDNGLDSEAELRPWNETTSAWVDNGPRRQKTRDTYRLMLRRFAKIAGPEFVEDVTEAMVSGFLVGLRNDGRSAATTAAYLRVLAAFFRSVRPGLHHLYIGTRETIALQQTEGEHTSVLKAPAWDAHLADVEDRAFRLFEINRKRHGGFLLLLQTPEWEFLTAVEDPDDRTSVGPIQERSLPMPSGNP